MPPRAILSILDPICPAFCITIEPMFRRLLALFGLGRLSAEQLVGVALSEGELEAQQTRCPVGWQYVRATDDWGRTLGERWEYHAPPDAFESNGFEHLRKFVDRFFASGSESVSIIAVSPQEDAGVHLFAFGEEVSTGVTVEPGSNREAKTIALAARLRLQVKDDYTMDDGRRSINWLVPKEPAIAFEVLKAIALEVEGLGPEGGLEIRFEEGHDPWPEVAGSGGISFRISYPIEDSAAPPPVQPIESRSEADP